MKTSLLAIALSAVALAQNPMDAYNVVWDSPSENSSGSMPLGNGDVGLNVWVEPNGDVLFNIGKTDAWSEIVRLLKIGRVRVRFNPDPFGPGTRFEQALRVGTGDIQMTARTPNGDARVTIWVDATNPVIRVDAETPQPTNIQVIWERWRDQQRLIEGNEIESALGLDGGAEHLVSYGDSVNLESENRLISYHRNAKSTFAGIVRHQGLGDSLTALGDPLLYRSFGTGIVGDGLSRANPTMMQTRTPNTKHGFSVYVLTAFAESPDEYVRQLNSLITRTEAMRLADRRTAHEKWWTDFWNRSFIRITGGQQQEAVSKGYVLQRFINACGGRGAYPIKSNGSIFTVDAKVGDQTFDSDFRKGGGLYAFQNTRLIYWPMLASGDFDLMQPFFKMYKDAQFFSQRRTKLYFNHEGAYFPELMYFWGAYPGSLYGWNRDGKPVSAVESTAIRNYFSGNLELVAMMLDYHSYTRDQRFQRETLIPLATDIINFYDKHYERDANGKMRIAPAQALGTFQDVVNPMPDVAGLKFVLTGMLEEKIGDRQFQNNARRILQQLPDLPFRDVNGKAILQPAERVFGTPKNEHNPELYAIFPFRLFGVEKTELETARNSFEARRVKKTGGWHPDAVHAARLGLTDEAKRMVVENFTQKPSSSRFPAFWGPEYEWTPDQTHGNVASLALQNMLLQSDGNKIILMPSWPKDWQAEFKLNAPDNTVVEGTYKEGKLDFRTTPAKRRADVVVKLEQ